MDVLVLVVDEGHHGVVGGIGGIIEVVLPNGFGILLSVVARNGLPNGALLDGRHGGIGCIGSGCPGGRGICPIGLGFRLVAGKQAQNHSHRQQNGKKLFHVNLPFKKNVSKPLLT